MPREIYVEDKPLLVGELVEATLTGGPGDHAVITLMVPVAKLDWNIHGHANGQSQTVIEELGVMGTSFVFMPSADTDWSLLLRNRNTMPMTVNVRIELHGDLEWGGWQ